MTPLQWVRVAAAFALIGLGAAGLFAGYPAVHDATMTGILALGFITAGVGALGIRLPAILTNRRNGER